MSELHDVIHELIDVAAGVKARLSVHEANLLHEGVDKALADATALDGPDSAPEPDGDDGAPAPSQLTNDGSVFASPHPADAPPVAG